MTVSQSEQDDHGFLYGQPVTGDGQQKVIYPHRENWLETATKLFEDDWNMCVDLTAVDYLNHMERLLPEIVNGHRFEIVASFISHKKKSRIRARVQIPETDLSLESLYNLYPGTDYLEREVFDMFGIKFSNHPDLSRILMPETWDGHPLLKDYAVGAIPVQFKHPQGGSSND